MFKFVDFGGNNNEYRYSLWRVWEDDKPFIQFIGLNPSIADDKIDDPTIRKCIGFSKQWGMGGFVMTNLFAWRATKPADMKAATDPIGPENDYFLTCVAEESYMTIAAWGVHGNFKNRDKEIKKLIPNLYSIKLTKDNHPSHPLMLPYNAARTTNDLIRL